MKHIKRRWFVDLPVEAVAEKKKYIVLKFGESSSCPSASTPIIDNQWEYSLPDGRTDITDVQFNYTPSYIHRLKVKCVCT